MKANALLMLSFDSPYEAAASGISTGHWRWSVANALKSERERITLRCTDPGNQPLDVQYVLGQDVLTEELLKGLTPIDLDDPNSTGNFNSCYLGVISIPAESNRATLLRVILYFGSATSVYGEVGPYFVISPAEPTSKAQKNLPMQPYLAESSPIICFLTSSLSVLSGI